MSQLQKLREENEKELEDFTEAKAALSSLKSDVTIMAVVALFSKVEESVNELLEVSAKKEYFDKELCKTIGGTLSKAVEVFSKIEPPVINVAAPQFNLQPILAIVAEIKTQNKNILGLVEKIINGNNSDELMRLIVALIGKQNAFLEKSLQQVDMRPELKSIDETLKDRASKWKIGNVTRSGGLFVSAEIEVVKQSNNGK